MKICILSDSHDHREYLAAAVSEAKALGAEAVLHCGDIVAPSTLHCIREFGIPHHVIHGNNEGDTYHLARQANKPGSIITYHGQDATLEMGGRRIFMVHYPHYARAMSLTGDYDLVCSGHEHKLHIDEITNIKGTMTYWVDPGTVGGVSAPPTYVIADLDTMNIEAHEVSLKA